ncbi:hypothetical protein H0H92_011389 [Tricholoma furcatifolium]|nr:hypothetical protein H0H92_011389 [Tricholoma furcatifolium]
MVGRPQKHLVGLDPPLRQLFAYIVLTLFVLFFLSGGLSYHFGFPFIGDLKTNHISYKPSSDVLIHVGDFLTKGPHVESMETLAFMTSHNITGVRGNHDQQVIQWRSWIRWIRTQPGGPRWLNQIHARWAAEAGGKSDPEQWLEDQKRKDKENKWWKKIPKGWTLFDTHFAIAHETSDEQYAYLVNLPYAIHIPSAHAFIVHGGMLPSNPKLQHDHSSQPLARVPRLPKGSNKNKNKSNDTLALRTLQEGAILTKIPQNMKPWNLLNIRSVLATGKVTKSVLNIFSFRVQILTLTAKFSTRCRNTDGRAWSKIWRQDMERCAGFNLELADGKSKKNAAELLPCYPSTVLYGHAASRGLDVKRWSIGLDTGCVYERHLTALVLGGKQGHKRAHVLDRDGDDDNNLDSDVVEFGDSHHGKTVSVRCP